jgi:shikimate kinase
LYTMKIYLIGYMGSGKSTVGELLAERMKLNFIDFDKYIERETGKTITEIFDTTGEEKFRELEHQHLKKLLRQDDVVVSLGGGTPCFYNNIELINKSGISVYLEMNVDSLVKRLSKARNKRPLIHDLNETELRYFIEANLEKRKMIYEQAHFSIKTSDLSLEKIVEEIKLSILNNNKTTASD